MENLDLMFAAEVHRTASQLRQRVLDTLQVVTPRENLDATLQTFHLKQPIAAFVPQAYKEIKDVALQIAAIEEDARTARLASSSARFKPSQPPKDYDPYSTSEEG